MMYLIQILKTLINVKNPWVIPLSYVLKGRRKAKFSTCDIEFDRNSISKVYDAAFLLSNGWKISRRGSDFLLECEGIKFLSPGLHPDFDDIRKMYHTVDYKGKVVLDIGGYVGDTAAFFKGWGAKKIIVYEPQKANIDYIKKNVELNKINAEIYPFSVWKRSGKLTFWVDQKSIGTSTFGLHPGKTKVVLKTISWKKVVKDAARKGVEIAKVNCEGAEKFMPSAGSESKKIPFWIVETHARDIKKRLIEYFTKISFDYRILRERGEISVIFFYKSSSIQSRRD